MKSNTDGVVALVGLTSAGATTDVDPASDPELELSFDPHPASTVIAATAIHEMLRAADLT